MNSFASVEGSFGLGWRFVAFVEQLVEWNLKRPRVLLQSFDGRDGVTILDESVTGSKNDQKSPSNSQPFATSSKTPHGKIRSCQTERGQSTALQARETLPIASRASLAVVCFQ